MIRCDCPAPHREHEFESDGIGWGLCRTCGHTVGAHRPRDVHDDVHRVLAAHEIEDYAIHVEGEMVRLDLRLRRRP